MNTSKITTKAISFHRDETMSVRLSDGRTITVPLAWYPRLLKAKPAAHRNWELCGAGGGIHWPDVDEDLSIEGMLRGQPSPQYCKHHPDFWQLFDAAHAEGKKNGFVSFDDLPD